MSTVEQIRSGRKLLGWSQEQLAEAAGIAPTIAARAETRGVSEALTAQLLSALVRAGVSFEPDGGVSLAKQR